MFWMLLPFFFVSFCLFFLILIGKARWFPEYLTDSHYFVSFKYDSCIAQAFESVVLDYSSPVWCPRLFVASDRQFEWRSSTCFADSFEWMQCFLIGLLQLEALFNLPVPKLLLLSLYIGSEYRWPSGYHFSRNCDFQDRVKKEWSQKKKIRLERFGRSDTRNGIVQTQGWQSPLIQTLGRSKTSHRRK